MEDPAGEITLLLRRMADGEQPARDRLFTLLYRELHGQAARLMRGQPANHTLQATALVNEAYFRVARQGDVDWADRRHFLAVAARAMRSVLVDHARAKGRRKRGGDADRLPLDAVTLAYEERSADLVDLDGALERLEKQDERAAELVTLRFFGGRTMPEAAEIVGVSLATAERDWTVARAWLKRELR